MTGVELQRHGLVAIVLTAIAVLTRVPTLAQPLVEAHAFRQTQTAYAAVIYHRDGIDLLNATVPVQGPPWYITLEFPLFQAIASVLMDLGMSPEVSLRSLSLLCFVITGLLLWRVLRRLSGPVAAHIGLAAFLFSPLGMLWSRTSMIEFMATAFALGFVNLALDWRERRQMSRLALAVIVGALAFLTKGTTAIYWIVPFVVLGFLRDPGEQRLRRSLDPAALAIVLIPLAVGLAWNAYSDIIKAASPGTVHLTTTALSEWYFGTIAQRLDPMSWARLAYWLTLAGGWLLPIAIPLALVAGRRFGHARFVVWMVLVIVMPVATFTNLYVVHDYYFAAVSPAVAALIGIGLGSLMTWLPSRRAAVVGVELLALWIVGVVALGAYWLPMYEPISDPEQVLPRAQQIREQSDPGDLIAINLSAWNPALFYYADRWGTVFDDGAEPPAGYVGFDCTPSGDAAKRCTRVD